MISTYSAISNGSSLGKVAMAIESDKTTDTGENIRSPAFACGASVKIGGREDHSKKAES